jgi:hypothetical protein
MNPGRVPLLSLYITAGVLALLLGRYVYLAPFGHDEVEHAHVSWRLLQGDQPYAEIHQNHAPLVWWVGAAALSVLPESADVVLALRLLASAAFLATIAAGWRLVSRIAPDLNPVVRPLALVAMLALAYRFEWFSFRPDPFMSLAATLALAVVAAPRLTGGRAVLAGALFGIAGCFSPKIWPLLAVLPARLVWDARSTRRRDRLVCLLAYVAGGVLGALPVAAWLTVEGLWPDFLRDVVAFNGTFPKPPGHALRFLQRPILVGALVGVAVMVWHASTRPRAARWPHVAVAAAVLLGFSAVFFTVHSAPYNQQAATVPAAIAFAVAGAALAGRQPTTVRLLLLALILTLCIRREVTSLATFQADGWHITQAELAEFVDLTHTMPERRCAAFAPCHPVFCQDASDLSLLWDTLFMAHPDPSFRRRHEQFWKDAVRAIEQTRPSLVVQECSTTRPWDLAAEKGVLTADDLERLERTLTAGYEPRTVGRNLVWVVR